MRAAVFSAVVVAAAVVAVASAPAASKMQLSCSVGGNTTVTGITAKHVHFKFRWWYANGSSYTASTSVWPDTKGTAYIPTRGAAVRAEAIEHRGRSLLAHVRASCS